MIPVSLVMPKFAPNPAQARANFGRKYWFDKGPGACGPEASPPSYPQKSPILALVAGLDAFYLPLAGLNNRA